MNVWSVFSKKQGWTAKNKNIIIAKDITIQPYTRINYYNNNINVTSEQYKYTKNI